MPLNDVYLLPQHTGLSDFPHPAFARLSIAKHTQVNESEVLQVSIDRGAVGGLPCALATPAQVARQTLAHLGIDLPEGSPIVSYPEVVRPTLEMPVEFADKLRQRLEAALFVDHHPQFLALSREGLLRRVHVPITQLSAIPVSIQPEAVTQEVQHRALLMQVDDT